MVRYMGCGANRVSREPPVSRSPLEPCWQKRDDGILSWMPLGAPCTCFQRLQASDVRRLWAKYRLMSIATGFPSVRWGSWPRYGPFWAVYSHPAFSLYGYRSQEEKEARYGGSKASKA